MRTQFYFCIVGIKSELNGSCGLLNYIRQGLSFRVN